MLVEGNMNIGSFGEDPQYSSGLSRQTSTKMWNKTLNKKEVNTEKAVHAKDQRAGHLGELRKCLNVVQDLIKGPGVELTKVEDSVARYE